MTGALILHLLVLLPPGLERFRFSAAARRRVRVAAHFTRAGGSSGEGSLIRSIFTFYFYLPDREGGDEQF